jgi:hypothetical protein
VLKLLQKSSNSHELQLRSHLPLVFTSFHSCVAENAADVNDGQLEVNEGTDVS